jgi:hypothetical protein
MNETNKPVQRNANQHISKKRMSRRKRKTNEREEKKKHDNGNQKKSTRTNLWCHRAIFFKKMQLCY